MSDHDPIDGNAMNKGPNLIQDQNLNQSPNHSATPKRRRTRRNPTDPTAAAASPSRTETYRQITNPFPPVEILSADQIASIHDTALRVLEELGIKVLLPEAIEIFRKGGAVVKDDGMVFFDRGLIAQTLASAPPTFELRGGNPIRNQQIGGKSFTCTPIGGPPHINDLDHGKRPGTLADLEKIVKLSQTFDVIHTMSPNVEPQDIPTQFRHLQMNDVQLTQSDKPAFVYSRGAPQVRDCFEMIRIVRGLDREAFQAAAYCYTVINTNSPRQLDIPMSQGIIDFARAGQMSVITPFTLAGAMAPVTITGALTLQHAEALAGICLAQLTRPGAPVVYGSFTSNVDMKSGAPAFGTPEYIKGSFAAGQLARHINLPWRSSNANASNAADAQATYEALNSIWAALMGGANILFHSAGWLEGGLTASLEKFIIDVEMLQIMAEACQPLEADEGALAFSALAEIQPGGHFFGADHTMTRYRDAFYQPLLSDWSNFGRWTETGAKTATIRANEIWKQAIAEFEPPALDIARRNALRDYIERRTAEGGAPPES